MLGISKQKRRKRPDAFNVIAVRTANPGTGVIEDELARLLIALKAIVLTIDAHLATESERVFALGPVQDRGNKVTADGTKLISVAIANRRASTSSAVEIEARKASNAFTNRIVIRSRKTEGRQIHPVLTFRRVRTADEAIEAVPEIEHSAGIESMNLVHHRLLGDEEKPVPDIDAVGVVVVATLPVVRSYSARTILSLSPMFWSIRIV